MVEVITVFTVISALVFIGYFSEGIFKKFRIPDVLILIIIGILIGPVLGWVSAERLGFASQLFTTFALVFILFQGALNINFRTLLHSFFGASKITIFSFFFTGTLIAVIAYYLFSVPILVAALFGTILGGTSSAVVIPMTKHLGMKGKYKVIATLESALSDVLCIVGTITVLAIMATGEVDPASIVSSVLSSFSLALVIGIGAGLIWVLLLTRSKSLMNSYMVTIAVVMGIYAFVESPYVGASGAISALAFGIILGNSKSILSFFKQANAKKDEEDIVVQSVLSPSAKNFYQEISFFVKVFFFIYLGILIDFSEPQMFFYGATLTLAIFLIRPLAVGLSFIGEKMDVADRTTLEVLVPKGLAAAVLAELAVQQGVAYSEILFTIILSVIFMSIFFTSVLAFLAHKRMFHGFFGFRRPRLAKIQKQLKSVEDDADSKALADLDTKLS